MTTSRVATAPKRGTAAAASWRPALGETRPAGPRATARGRGGRCPAHHPQPPDGTPSPAAPHCPGGSASAARWTWRGSWRIPAPAAWPTPLTPTAWWAAPCVGTALWSVGSNATVASPRYGAPTTALRPPPAASPPRVGAPCTAAPTTRPLLSPAACKGPWRSGGGGAPSASLWACPLRAGPALGPLRRPLRRRPQDCRDACCNATSCRLAAGAECAHGACCHQCRVSAAPPGAPRSAVGRGPGHRGRAAGLVLGAAVPTERWSARPGGASRHALPPAEGRL